MFDYSVQTVEKSKSVPKGAFIVNVTTDSYDSFRKLIELMERLKSNQKCEHFRLRDKRGVCMATQYMENCSCNGDTSNCDKL